MIKFTLNVSIQKALQYRPFNEHQNLEDENTVRPDGAAVTAGL